MAKPQPFPWLTLLGMAPATQPKGLPSTVVIDGQRPVTAAAEPAEPAPTPDPACAAELARRARQREAHRRWRDKNRAHVRETGRRWYAQYYADHAEAMRAKAREKYRKNGDAQRARQRAYIARKKAQTAAGPGATPDPKDPQ